MNAIPRRAWMTVFVTTCGLMGLLVSSTGCLHREATAENGPESGSTGWFSSGPRIPAGTSIEVRLTTSLSSEHASEGTRWNGVTTGPVMSGDKAVFDVGSVVTGTVTSAIPARRGDRAMLDLRIDRIDSKPVRASTDPVFAGSPRARNLGAIAGGTAAGALIGKAVGGDGKDAAIGGLIGGAAATGAVAASKGYQVVLKRGTVMTFVTDDEVAVR